MCFDKEEQEETELRLQYDLFCAEIVRLYL